MTNNYMPTEAVDQLNFLSTVQFDLEQARSESNKMATIIRRQSDSDFSDYDDSYNPKQDNAALRVARTAIDGLQARLDAYVAANGPVVTPEAQKLSHEAHDLGGVISEYISAYLSPKEVKA